MQVPQPLYAITDIHHNWIYCLHEAVQKEPRLACKGRAYMWQH
jgi:hypothetical protein